MDITWNIGNQEIVTSLNSREVVSRYDFYLRDTIPVTLTLCVPQSTINQPFAVTSLAGGESILFGAKAAVTDEDFLFSQATWTPNGSGTTQTYVADIDLNVGALIAAIGSSEYLDVIAEFTILTAGNENHSTTQVTFRIFPDVIVGDEGVPSSAQYPVVAQYSSADGVPSVRLVNASGEVVCIFRNGSPFVFILATGLWYPLVGTIVDGIPVIALGAGENM